MAPGEDLIWHYFYFHQKILNGEAIDVFNNGQHSRDFTYIDDIVEGVVVNVVLIKLLRLSLTGTDKILTQQQVLHHIRLYNIGNNIPVELLSIYRSH